MEDSTKKSNLTAVETRFIWMMCAMNDTLKASGGSLESFGNNVGANVWTSSMHSIFTKNMIYLKVGPLKNQ